MIYPSKKEFDRYELKRPDFRTRFWHNWKRHPVAMLYFRNQRPLLGTKEWWAWVDLGIKEERAEVLRVRYFFKEFLAKAKPSLPLSLGSGKTVKFTRLQRLPSLEKK